MSAADIIEWLVLQKEGRIMQRICLLKRAATALLVGSLSFIACSSAEAAGPYLLNFGLNNQNAADISTTPHYEFIFGGDDLNLHVEDRVKLNAVPGSATSGESAFLPYFRAAVRVSPKLVLGFDYKQPDWININYGLNSFVSQQSVLTTIRAFDLNPRFSFQINPNVAIGMGFDALHTSGGNISAQVGTPVFAIIDQGSAWGYGWDAGIFTTIRKGTYASLAYFSSIQSYATGGSHYGPFTSNNTTLRRDDPTTFVLRLTQFFSPSFFVQLYGAYDEASVAQNLVFNNTALGQVVMPQRWSNSFQLGALTHFNLNKDWSFLVGGQFEDGPQPAQTNYIGLPVGNLWSIYLGPAIQITKKASFQLIYAHAWAYAGMNYRTAPPFNVSVLGQARENANVLGLRLSFKA